ncbi:MAG: PQQ-binding-like beta-propeller repeat protein [Candidatus Bathyarchaeia archaeon]
MRFKRVLGFSAVLLFTIVCLASNLNAAIAQQKFEFRLFISVAPSPVGVNQAATVMVWTSMPPPTAAGAGGDRWKNIVITVTKPDGTTETKGPFESDAVGGIWCAYTPDQVGTYYFQASFPGQWINTTTYKRWYVPVTSKKLALTVQQETVEAWPELPLPTGYWTRPINAELREWYQISSNWLMPAYNFLGRAFDSGSAFSPHAKAPESPHIVWTKELTFGGIIGGEFGYGINYYTGMSYEMKFTPPTIISGKLYYNIHAASEGPGVICVDLRTGEQIWRNDTMPRIVFGQIFDYESPNQHGAYAYLWSIVGTTWYMIDAFTGHQVAVLANASVTVSAFSTNVMFGPHGEVLVYILNNQGRWLAMWNSSAIPAFLGGATGSAAWQWRPWGKKADWRTGIQWNVSIAKPPELPGTISFYRTDGNVLVTMATFTTEPWPTIQFAGLSLKPENRGKLLWVKNYTDLGVSPTYLWWPYPNEGVFAVSVKDTKNWHVYDINTGQKLFTTEPVENDWGMYDYFGVIAYGKLYTAGYSGSVHCYDIKTGKHLWDFDCGSAGLETPYGTWPLYGGITVADGKLYVANGEHSPGTPMWRGYKLYCINAETGEKIWDITMWCIAHSVAIADGYLVGYSGYDNRIYCFGKGKTQTTLTITQDVIQKGSSVLIKGYVTDLSPAVKGTPCVADESMSGWMEYLVMQKPMPQDVEGVTVELYAIDENGASTKIGEATTDPLNGGLFSLVWTPPKEGIYTITAVFPGSKSYWDSCASTAIAVTAAPPEAPAPATAEQAQTTQAAVESLQTWNMALTVMVAIAIVVGVANLYMLIKRK